MTDIGRDLRKRGSRPRHEVHDVVHEAVMAGYAAALSDLEEGKLDDQVRERSEVIE